MATTKPKKKPAGAPIVPLAAPDAVPRRRAPSVPTGFKAPAPANKRSLRKATPVQENDAAQAADEVSSSKTWAADFGPHAPAAKALAAALSLAAGWSAENVRAKAWAGYTQTEKDIAWGILLAMTASFKSTFQDALTHDPTIRAAVHVAESELMGARSGAGESARSRYQAGEEEGAGAEGA